METAARKTRPVYCLGKRNVLRFDLKEGRLFHVRDRKQKGLRNQQGKVWYEESGSWEYQKQSGEYGRVCKDIHKNKMEQCASYIYNRECLSCTGFFFVLGASGAIETEELWGQLNVLFSMRRAAQLCMRRRLRIKEAGRPERRELQ